MVHTTQPAPPRSHKSRVHNFAWFWTHHVPRSTDLQSRQQQRRLFSSGTAWWISSVEGQPRFRWSKALGWWTWQTWSLTSRKTQRWQMAPTWRLHQQTGRQPHYEFRVNTRSRAYSTCGIQLHMFYLIVVILECTIYLLVSLRICVVDRKVVNSVWKTEEEPFARCFFTLFLRFFLTYLFQKRKETCFLHLKNVAKRILEHCMLTQKLPSQFDDLYI